MGSNLIGQILVSQFRVDAFVDSGAMGAVYKVWDLKRNVPLAMKVLHADLADDPSILKRFRREANALRKLTHPNIVPFYGLYLTPDFAFLLEHFVDGYTLKEILRKHQGLPLDIPQAMCYLKALCAALGYAHLHGVVHCDVKPGNVMQDHGGNIYLTDFGIARHSESTTTTLATAGTTAYMAPEQIRGESVTAAADIYALGVMLFEMLTGQRPFRGSDSGSDSSGATAAERIRYAHLYMPPPNPSTVNPALPDELAVVILKALSKDPYVRYQDVNHLLADAVKAAGLQGDELSVASAIPPAGEVLASATVQPASQVPPPFTPIAAGTVVPREKPASRRALTCGLVLVGAILLAGLALAMSGGARFDLSFFKGLLPDGQDKVALVAVNTHTPAPQMVKSPTKTSSKHPTSTVRRPTSTRAIPTRTYQPPTQAPRPHTNTPLPPIPRFTAGQNMFCRDGPGESYEAHVTIMEGEVLQVLRKWSDGEWLLVEINRSDTRTKCCWLGGEGSLNVDQAVIQAINFLPDRIRCELNP
jgi:hypothetical protein